MVAPASASVTTVPDAAGELVGGLFWTHLRPLVFRKLVAWAREQETVLLHGLSAVTTPVAPSTATP